MLKPDTFVSVDVETTGLDANLHEIVEIGAVKVVEGNTIAEYSELVKPLKPLPDFITHLTGITAGDLKHAPSVRDVMPSFLDFVSGFKIVGQNIGFDVAFLRNSAGMGNFSAPVDTAEFARVLVPMLPSFSLDSLIEFFALEPETRHRALEDARMTAHVYLRLLDMMRVLPDGLLAEMNALSSRTGSGLAEVFEAHLMERIEKPTAFRGPVYPQDSRVTRPDNLFGDFSSDIMEFGEGTGGFVEERKVEEVLRTGGALSLVHEDFEERPGQIALARRMVRAFNEAEIFLAEAGTGTGKSIAYLAPSILFAESAHERVVISTNTKNLQEQLFFKDIPLLAKMLDFKFRAVILKGRGNYICLTRWNRLIQNPDQYLTRQERGLVLPVAAWLHATTTGDLSETGFFPMMAETGLLERINSEPVSCLGPRCRHREQCFVNKIRHAARRAHIVIVNHSLVFSDMVSDGAVLGGYARIVFDEAHNLEKVAMRYLGVTLTYSRVRRILNRLHTKSEGSHGILAALESWAEKAVAVWPELESQSGLIRDAIDKAHTVRSRSQEFFQRINTSVSAAAERAGDTGQDGKLRYYPESPVFRENETEVESFRQSIENMMESLVNLSASLAGVSPGQLAQKEETLLDIEKTGIDLESVITDLAFLVEAGGRNVYWFEFDDDDGSRFVRIQSAPLDVAERLAGGLYDHMETVIMTSATLTVANDFSYIRGRLGLDLDSRERVTEFIAASPFDHQRQAALIAPSFMPSPKEDDFFERTNEAILALADGVRRGMLVLFTSRGQLQKTYNDLRNEFSRRGITLLAQGIEGSRNALLRRFREDVTSVLFGTDSFWEGVDVPGKALELVVIVRLPFAVPTDPVVQAQIEEIERSGRNAFTGYSVPEAAIKLRQGAGRLIRHRNDRGAVIVLDSRISTARYGAIFKRSLPGRSLKADSPEVLVELLKRWFGEDDGAA